QGRYSDNVIGGDAKDDIFQVAVVRVLDWTRVPADIPGAIGSNINIPVKAGGGDPLNRGKPVHVIDLETRHLVVVHHFVGGPLVFLINVREGKPIPIMRPGLGGGFVEVALVVDVILARVGFGTVFELLTVLEGLVFDLNNLRRVLPVAELLH